MRRALTAGLALYLGLSGVLSSPVQVQVPFELNKENIPKVEDVPSPGSEFQLFFSFRCLFFLAVFYRGGFFGERAAGIESRLIRIVVTRAAAATPRTVFAHHRPPSRPALSTRRSSVHCMP